MTTQKLSNRPSGRPSAALAAAILGVLAAPVLAQTPPPDEGAIAEVVVTAQKRSESLQSVPVSVTALTSAQLGELKMDSPSDLTTQIPNLQVNGIVGEGSPIFSLRGVSMFDYSLSQSSPVASYIDEVYKGNFVLFGVEMYDL
ncbi:MAG TPA: Plug domain-containing protein, partial [Steroidobacteraceae bacterium]|nr:Plug domain-containing protein [Steroidobacteraceae bacterium]